MPNLLTIGAEWLADQQAEHCGQTYVYDCDGSLLDIPLVPDVRSDQHRTDLTEDESLASRTRVFAGKASEFTFDDVAFLPQAGHRIIREADGEEPQEYVVFPVFGQQVFKPADPFKRILRVSTIPKCELAELTISPPGLLPFTAAAVMTDIRGDLEEQAGRLVKIMRQTAHVSTRQMTAGGVTEVQRNATVATVQFPDWSIDLSLSRWGAGRVTLELVRRPLANEKNMERNAAL